MDPMTAVHNATNTTASAVEVTPAALLLSSVALFLLALGPIFFGSLRSKQPQEKDDMEVVTSRSAAIFPVIASGALLSIYIVFKFLPTYYINLLVNFYFSLLGTGAMVKLLSPMLRPLVPQSVTNNLYKIELTKSSETKAENSSCGWKVIENNSVECETRDVPGIVTGVVVGVWYFATRHWIANNCVAYSLAMLAIEYIKLNKFVNGCLLLGGLFFYDIFWVFGTPVMVSVAKSLDAPIKMSFPRDFLVRGFFGKEFAILGLGDIVVPGIFIAMLLRFDASLQRKDSRLYFFTGYIAYVVGLLTTFIVMHVFKAAQPALLYLVPACLGCPLFLAWIKGDIKAMLAYEDVPEHQETTQENSAKTSETKVQDQTQSVGTISNSSKDKEKKVN